MDNANFTVVTLVVSFLGGGVVSALIAAVRSECADVRSHQLERLKNQINKLYGPLHLFVLQSEKLFQLNQRFHNAYNLEYVQQKWSMEEFTQRALKLETTQTLALANQYVHLVLENNQRMQQVLSENFSLIDPEDIEMFVSFFEHHIRHKVEVDEEGRIKTAHRIYKHVGNISLLRPEVITGVKAKFLRKKALLDQIEASLWDRLLTRLHRVARVSVTRERRPSVNDEQNKER